VHRGFERRGQPGRLECDVDAETAGFRANRVAQCGRIERAGVERMRRAETLRGREALRRHVDGDDRGRALQLREHDQQQSDWPEAEHRAGIAEPQLAAPQCMQRDGGGLEHCRLFERDALGQAMQHIGRHDREVGHSAVAHEPGKAHRYAEVVRAGPAVRAALAAILGLDRDAVAGAQRRYARADFDDGAAEFVTERQRCGAPGQPQYATAMRTSPGPTRGVSMSTRRTSRGPCH